MKKLIVVFILLVGCDLKIKNPSFTPPPEPKGFDASLCPKFKSGYYNKDTGERVMFTRQANALVIRDRNMEFLVDGAEHSMSDGSTYIGGCLNGYAQIAIKSMSKKSKEIYSQIFYGIKGGKVDRGVIIDKKPAEQAVLWPLGDS